MFLLLFTFYFVIYLGKENAVIIVLSKNDELEKILKCLNTFERMFNSKYRYPYVFFNDSEFSEEYKNKIRDVISSTVEFGLLSSEEWGVPGFIDNEKMFKKIREMKKKNIKYGGLLSYRKMCRFYSGFFYRNELVAKYDYYWRIEPDIEFFCEIKYDPFLFVKNTNKKYGFVISVIEIMETVPTLWNAVSDFIEVYDKKYPNYKMKERMKNIKNKDKDGDNYKDDYGNLRFVTDGHGFNGCHFWSNFEIAAFDFFRSKIYSDFFNFLDRKGGFFYERWGDAPIHSIAVSLFLKKNEIHFFGDIGYYHPPVTYCPSFKQNSLCKCDREKSFNYKRKTCLDKLEIKQYL
ncbi:glycolipid 2-alpha-mannosyltransferase [Hamiltosporidium tvaerminnensis]|uniref:Glycolipid 2-alpha-mannosyltransferase n=1 Tax=Hamiltosporidium tvaerminnensis TaxID=1176355 RepID=A0A4Q9KU24_9MICR|nr:hypothetical protein LUQ84_002525 [Hamiltosporidium tvaerminnensis]TBT98308.1 glycolipid 2-alpha-mannosyltransferase [Hamiltosporidium tvaerminnensis]